MTRSVVFVLMGVLFVILMISYYFLVNRVLEQRESLEIAVESLAKSGDHRIEIPASPPLPQVPTAAATILQLQQSAQNDTWIGAAFAKIYESPLDPERKPKATIAYLTSITACPTDHKRFIGIAAVLRHSIHLASIRNPESSSVYDYDMYAIIHTEAAAKCADGFRHIGYKVLIKETPVALHEIVNEKYVNRLVNPNAGCCAEKEFLKLYAYTMHDYPLAVHLDMDFLVLKPMDELFNVFFQPDEDTKEIPHAMWPADRHWTGRIESMFTRDYPMAHPGRETVKVGMQGGFWIVRPNQTAFDEMVGLIKQGNFEGGWYDGKVHYPGCKFEFSSAWPTLVIVISSCS